MNISHINSTCTSSSAYNYKDETQPSYLVSCVKPVDYLENGNDRTDVSIGESRGAAGEAGTSGAIETHQVVTIQLPVDDPRQWTENHVAHWLQWAAKEFSLENIPLHHFQMKGKDICVMGKDTFSARAPAFVGDILWEHLELLQKDIERERYTMFDNVCVPDIPQYIDYSQAPGVNPAEDRKPVSVTAVTPPPANSAASSHTNNNFLHDGKRMFENLYKLDLSK
ncbi:hypothetical protein GWI33_013435 [Rhynchophorus ferrugineus]|uniref:PNT domain-containing protein n=1 Tax=Rhynchophorus ferrugineus TaxID=354439 RepID=A0A834I4M2_RHYFE|nr:hypothetical protein GWI33_013435 [Rhynchophorus ferrugineus]